MKKNIGISIIAFFVFTISDFLLGMVFLSLHNNFCKITNSIPLHFLFCVLIFLSFIPEIPIRKSLRFPILRALIWLLICLVSYFRKNRIDTELIDSVISAFWYSISHTGSFLSGVPYPTILQYKLFGIAIAGISLYQFIVIELANCIVNLVFRNCILRKRREIT